jgi:hypothetical protein
MISMSKTRLIRIVVAAMTASSGFSFIPAIAGNEDAQLEKDGFRFEISILPDQSAVRLFLFPSGVGGLFSTVPVSLRIKGKIDFKRQSGYVGKAGLFNGQCEKENCGASALLWYRKKGEVLSGSDGGGLLENDWSFDQVIEVPGNRLISPDAALYISDRCDRNPQDTFFLETSVTLSVDTRSKVSPSEQGGRARGGHFPGLDDVGYIGGDQSAQANLELPIACVQMQPCEGGMVDGSGQCHCEANSAHEKTVAGPDRCVHWNVNEGSL